MPELVQVEVTYFPKGLRTTDEYLDSEFRAWYKPWDKTTRSCLSPEMDTYLINTGIFAPNWTDNEFTEDNYGFDFQIFGNKSSPDEEFGIDFEMDSIGSQELFEPYLEDFINIFKKIGNPPKGFNYPIFVQFVIVCEIIYTQDYSGDWDSELNILGMAEFSAKKIEDFLKEPKIEKINFYEEDELFD